MALRSASGHVAGSLTLVSGMPGDFQGAIAAYTQAIELDPNHFKAYFNRGFAHDKLGQFDKAIFDYSKALLIEPNNAYAFYNRGISHDRRWVCRIAYVCLVRPSLAAHGFVFRGSSNFAEAISNFSRAIELLPHNADFYHNRGFCYRKQGNFVAAINDYTRALVTDPRHFKAVYNRAFSYDKVGWYLSVVWRQVCSRAHAGIPPGWQV